MYRINKIVVDAIVYNRVTGTKQFRLTEYIFEFDDSDLISLSTDGKKWGYGFKSAEDVYRINGYLDKNDYITPDTDDII